MVDPLKIRGEEVAHLRAELVDQKRTTWAKHLCGGITNHVADATAEVLRPGGAFLVYQFSPKVRDFLSPNFERIDHDMEWWNVPPAQLYWAWKD